MPKKSLSPVSVHGQENLGFKIHVMICVVRHGHTMNRSELEKTVANLTQEIDLIADEKIKSIQQALLNLFEFLLSENDKLRAQNQILRDENNRFKGEQGKPNIRKQTQGGEDISSESNRKPRGQQKKKQSKNKKNKIKIDRMVICYVDKKMLPSDAKFKGYQSVVVQDVVIQTDNIEFKKQVYYSPLLKKTYMADLPRGYYGEFGPRFKALVVDLHHSSKMTESAIHTFLSNHGIVISAAMISRVITDKHEDFPCVKISIRVSRSLCRRVKKAVYKALHKMCV